MFDLVEQHGRHPAPHRATATPPSSRDVATPKDATFIQTNVVRVNGRRQVYIPVYRQLGASTLQVVDTLKASLGDMKARLTTPDVDLKVVMDQSVYVRQSIESLVEEGVLGAVLCSLVILLFLGEWRMTVIAVLTHPDRRSWRPIACLLRHGQHDQRDDAGRAGAGDRPAGRQRDHLPGEHAPPPRPGGHARARRPTSGRARWRCPSWSRASARSWCSRRWR